MNSTSPPENAPLEAQQPTGASVQLRYCNYLRLIDAKRFNKISSKTGFFNVPTMTCWVVVALQDLGFRSVVVLPLLDDAQVAVERQKGLQANLAKVSPTFANIPSWVLDIPERYPVKLLSEVKPEHGESRRNCKVRLREPAQNNPKEPYSKAEVRYCYYLHLDDADTATQSCTKPPMLEVPYKCRWVLVRKYLHDGTAQIYKLTSSDETVGGSDKPFHVWLGKIVPKQKDSQPQIDSWAQCVLERYPQHLMRDATVDFGKTPRTLDMMETLNVLKTIQSKSPEHWLSTS
jgi:hypothetical protein